MFRDYRLSRFFGDPVEIDPEDDPMRPDIMDRLRPFMKIVSGYFRTTFHGLGNIPRKGPALLVGNHGIMGLDAPILFYGIYNATGRMPRGIGDYHLFLDPILRGFWTRMGAIPGTRENALRFLSAGHLVNVYPGGARDALKGKDARYRLHWEKSTGFIEVAMAARVPVILHMGIGTDDTYRILGKLRLTGKILGHEKYSLPLWLGWGMLPRPVKFTYYISEPIHLEGGPDDLSDRDLVKKNHAMVWDIAKKMIEKGLEKRRSVWFG